MKNEKSYTELMKTKAQEKRNLRENFITNMYVQMIIDEALYNFQKEQYIKQIDEAIDNNNKPLFHSLSKEYELFITSWEK